MLHTLFLSPSEETSSPSFMNYANRFRRLRIAWQKRLTLVNSSLENRVTEEKEEEKEEEGEKKNDRW